MSKNATPESAMGSLHVQVAKTLVQQLKGQPQYMDPEDPERVTGHFVDPRYIQAAISFLNNNKVMMDPYVEEMASEIQEALRARKQRFKIVAADEAAKAAANE